MTPVTHSFIAYTRGAGAVPGRGRLLGVPASAHPPRRRRETSLAVRLLALQGLMVGAVVLTSTIVAYGEAQEAVRESAEQEATAIVASLADSPAGARRRHRRRTRRPCCSPTSRRSAPTPARRSSRSSPPTAPGTPTRTRTRSAGRSAARSHPLWRGRRSPRPTPAPSDRRCGRPVRCWTPTGRSWRWCRRGSRSTTIGEDLAAAVPGIVGTGAATLAVGALGSWALSRRVRRQTHGLSPARAGADGGVPRGRAACRARGPAPGRRRAARPAGQRRGQAAAGPGRRSGRAAPRRTRSPA